jgi:hypothetical protein
MTTRVFFLSLTAALAIFPVLVGCGGNEPTKPAEPPLPRLEHAIGVSIRTSLLDSSSGVLKLTNRTKGTLDASLLFKNKDNGQSKSHKVSIPPFRTEEIGILEADWKFEPNETIWITCEGFSSMTYKTYRTSEGQVGIKQSWW